MAGNVNDGWRRLERARGKMEELKQPTHFFWSSTWLERARSLGHARQQICSNQCCPKVAPCLLICAFHVIKRRHPVNKNSAALPGRQQQLAVIVEKKLNFPTVNVPNLDLGTILIPEISYAQTVSHDSRSPSIINPAAIKPPRDWQISCILVFRHILALQVSIHVPCSAHGSA